MGGFTPFWGSPVKDLITTLDVEAEVGEGNRAGSGLAGDEVPSTLIPQLLPLLPLLPAPLALLVPGLGGKRRIGWVSEPQGAEKPQIPTVLGGKSQIPAILGP